MSIISSITLSDIEIKHLNFSEFIYNNPNGNGYYQTSTESICETPENPNFLRKDKMVISVKIQKFSRSQMTKRTSPLESSREI